MDVSIDVVAKPDSRLDCFLIQLTFKSRTMNPYTIHNMEIYLLLWNGNYTESILKR